MNPHFLLITLLSFTLAACGYQTTNSNLSGSTTTASTDECHFPHYDNDLPLDDKITYGCLDNGIRYGVMHNANPSGGAALWVRFATGSLNEQAHQRGAAHFLEHMAFNGTQNIPEGELEARLGRVGLSLGSDMNATTGFTRTTYTLDFPNVNKDMLDEGLFLMREIAENVTLEPSAIERERGVILSEKRSVDTSGARSNQKELSFFNAGSGLVDRFPIGIQKTIETMSHADLKKYYRDYYHPQNTTVVFVGDLDENTAIDHIKKHFASWQPDSPAAEPRKLQAADTTPGRIGYYHNPNVETIITIAIPRPKQDSKDNRASRRNSILVALGKNIFIQRMRKIADDEGSGILATNNRSFSYYEAVDGPKLAVRTTPEEWRQALATIDREMRSALTYKFLPSELKEQITNLKIAYSAAATGASNRRTVSIFGRDLISGVINSVSGGGVLTHPKFNLELFNSVVNDLSVDDVWQAFRKEWTGFDQPTIYLSTSAVLEEPESDIRAAFESGRKQPPAPPVEKQVAPFAYTDFGTPGDIVSDTYLEEVDSHLIRFKNNVLLNFKQTDFQPGTVRIVAHVGDGSLSIPRKDEALRRLGQNLMSGGGLEAHSNDEIQSLMVGRSVNIRMYVGPATESIGFHGTTSPKDFATQLNLMTAYLTAPGFRANARDKYLRGLRAWYPTHESSLQQVADKYVPKLLRSGDQRFGYPDLDGFSSPTNEEAIKWLKPQLLEGFTEVTIIGDIDKDTAVKEVARTFGALAERKARRDTYPDMLKLTFPQSNEKPAVIHHAGASDLSSLRIYWPALKASNPFVNRQLEVLRTLLRKRLESTLRERDSVTYSPSVGIYAEPRFKNYGYLFVTLDLSPNLIEEIEKSVFSEIDAIAKGEFSEDEFERAIGPIQSRLSRRFNSNGYWGSTLFNAQSAATGLNKHRTLIPDYSAITIDHIKAIAKEVLRKDTAYRIHLMPKTE